MDRLCPLVGLRPPSKIPSFSHSASPSLLHLYLTRSKTQHQKGFALHAGALSLWHSPPQRTYDLMLVPRKKWPVPPLTGVYNTVRVPRNLDSLFCNYPVFATFFYWVLFLALWVSSNHTLSLIRIKFLESPIRVWPIPLSVSLIIHMEILVAWRLLLIREKDFFRVAECNQDFVAPAPCHMPVEIVGVRVREH